MFNLNISLVIIAIVVLSCITNVKVVLPRFKFFISLIILTIGLSLFDCFDFFSDEINLMITNSILVFYLAFIAIYIERSSLLCTKKRIRKKTFIPFISVISTIILTYVGFILVDVHKTLPYYKMIEHYTPFIICSIELLWILVESMFQKDKIMSVILSVIFLSSAIIPFYFFNENLLSISSSLTLLFLYNGIENNINYYDINKINYNSNIFNAKFSSKKLKSQKILFFVKLDSVNIDKKTNLSKVFGKRMFKFKKNLFGGFLKSEHFFELMSEKCQKYISLKINDKEVLYDYHIYYARNDFYNPFLSNMSVLIDYISTIKSEDEKENFCELSKKDIDSILRNKKLLEIIDDAVKNDGFEIFYQPIYSTKQKRFASAEALIRLKNTQDLGYVSPEVFIPMAEYYGYAEAIGNIVFEKVCSCYNTYHLKTLGINYIELNISGLHIVKENIVSDFQRIINKYQMHPENINIEITETVQINNQNQMNKNLQSLRNLGFKFSMDDFGTGYSNMSNIIENNYELIKIDKSIVWGALKKEIASENSEILLKTCILLAHKLNRKIVAEGIEDEVMVNYLETQGVEYLQGYFFSKPICEQDFINFLTKKNVINDSWSGNVYKDVAGE